MKGWTFEDVNKLTIFERSSIIRIINKEIKDKNRITRKNSRKNKRR